jgi:hypothetical protein
MLFTSEDFVVLVRSLNRLFAILERPRTYLGSNSSRWWGILLPHSSHTLTEVNALAIAVRDLAKRAKLEAVVYSLPDGYGPLRIPAYEIEGAVQVTDQVHKYAKWRAGIELLAREADNEAKRRGRGAPSVASSVRYDLPTAPVSQAGSGMPATETVSEFTSAPRLSRKNKNDKVTKYLSQHASTDPDAVTVRSVAEAIGLPPSTVGDLCAWRAYSRWRKQGKVGALRTRQLTEQMLAVLSSSTTDDPAEEAAAREIAELSRDEQLALLIQQQADDENSQRAR